MARTIRNPEARTRIVEAAWRVVAAEGVHGATMRGIAAEAGVTTGFVTHYFDDKQALLAEVLRHNNLRARDRVLAAIGEQRGLVALEGAVEAMLPIDADRRREWQVGVACWGPTAPGERAAEELRGGWRFLESLLATLLEQAVEDGELPRHGRHPLRGGAPGDADRRRRHARRHRVARSGSAATPSGCSPTRSRAWNEREPDEEAIDG